MTGERTSEEETRAIRLVEYLTRLASLRTKIVRELSEDTLVLWINKIPREKGCFTQAWGANEEYTNDIWVEVQTYREPEIPSPPEICRRWINNDTIKDTKNLPALLETIIEPVKNPGWREGSDQPQYINQTIYLENCHRVKEEWNKYIELKWLAWAAQHKKWEKVHEAYSTLFSIHQEQLRLGEEYELVLGIGLLTWQTPNNQRVRRHLVVANAILEFEARLGKFTVRPNPDGANLRPELDMLDVEEQPARAEDSAKDGLLQAADDPWDKDCVDGVLRALVHSMNTRGEYHDQLEPESPQYSDKPIVEYSPAIILRKRSIRGLTEVLKRIKKRIEEDGVIPPEFRDIAEITCDENDDFSEESDVTDIDFDGEVYFPKPFNEEQRRIIEKIRSSNGVLVQGPPGTGKSHTIANLICHLLATGKRILITAKTPRALKVLEGHVPPEIRPLCINLLGSGIEERKALETSVNSILQKNEQTSLFENALKAIQKGEDNLCRLREEKAEITNRLRAIRESETHSQTIVDGAYRGTTAQIARQLEKDENKYGWLRDEVDLVREFPVPENELCQLLSGLRIITDQKKKELEQSWPDLNSIPNLEQLQLLVDGEQRGIEQETALSKDIDTTFLESISELPEESICSLLENLNHLTSEIQRIRAIPHNWISDAISDVSSGDCAIWKELSRFSQKTINNLTNIVTKADSTNITLPDDRDIRLIYEDALVMQDHLKNGGKLGWGPFSPGTIRTRKYIIKTIRVNGHPCNNFGRVSLLVDALRVQTELKDAWAFCEGRFQKSIGPYSLQFRAFVSLADTLSAILVLEGNFNRCKNILLECRHAVQPVWNEESSLRLLARTCDYVLARIQRVKAESELKKEESWIANWIHRRKKNEVHPVTNELLEAIRLRNVELFASCCEKIEELDQEWEAAYFVDKTFRKLRQVAPHLADDLSVSSSDTIWNERVNMLPHAWRWAQARTWIYSYLNKEDMPSLERRVQQIESEISRIIAHVASLKAWSFCLSRMNEGHRRHMEAWQQEIRKVGKGTGKWAPMHRREAQKHLNECREAVPAWIMPLHRIWDTVDPSPGMFDVIIVDEASQCGFEAIPLLYLGRKILIVGDDKQISPAAVGAPQSAINQLMEQYLYDFKFKSSFDMVGSLFAHAKLRYATHRIALREHFRCMPEIISFSNDLCYSDTPLIPLRQYGSERLEPIRHVYLDTGYREGSGNRVINRPEARAIVDKILELCHDDRYTEKTMGVIVLQGNAQAGLIESQLLECLGAEEMDRRRLICGNPYSFQGDERDIIFLSMVAAPNERIGAMTKGIFEKIFNVAASRAKDQMWLFHSVTQNDLSDACLRKHLLKHFEETQIKEIAGIVVDDLRRKSEQANRSIEKPPRPFDSWFEVDVALEIASRGYRVIPQLEIAGKFIDIVIEGGQSRLAIECYGDYWHGVDQYEQDMARQRKLERCGWVFYIIRESAFYANKEVALSGLWRVLEERGIYPQFGIHSSELPLEEVQEKQDQDVNIVEIGDTVIYIDEDEPDVEKQALITRGSSNPDSGEVNVNTPIAQALLGACVGEDIEISLPNRKTTLRIIEIHKHT
jgi:very-short-patch-repair endonuclease